MSRLAQPFIGHIPLLLFTVWGLTACEDSSAKELHDLPQTIPERSAAKSADLNKKRPQAERKGEVGTQQSARRNATTEAHRTSTISPTTPGLIQEVHVQEGDYVAKGDVLVTLDRTTAELRMRQAQAGLRMAQAQAKAAKTEATRARVLRDDRAIPVAQLDRANASLSIAHAGVGQAKAAVAVARKAVSDSVIHAPYDGVVARRMASEGEFASAMPPKMLVQLQEVSPIDLRITIPAASAATISVGMPLTVYFDGRAPMQARIVRISPALDPRTRSLSAIAELPNTDRAIRPGVFAEVELGQGPNSP